MTGRVFIDLAVVHVRAGDGGNGCMAFRREKYVPRGGPSGGDGGDGGSVYLETSSDFNTLFHFKKYPHHRAERGGHGKGSNKHGKNGKDCILKVPVGTLVYDDQSGDLLWDLTEQDRRVQAARGGKGGKGNARFATSTMQAPRFCEEGKPGEEKQLRLELKLMARVGLVGLPNAGKSTLLSVISAARPKIASYAFTTLVPQMGVVTFGDYSTTTVAEIPGIIEGAHEGKGLGDQFLRHVERVQLICCLVDAASDRDPLEDLETLRNELKEYGRDLEAKPWILVATKADAVSDESHLDELRNKASTEGVPFVVISAVARTGLDDLRKLMREGVK